MTIQTQIEGVVFDMDGLLLDTERLSSQACQTVCRSLGYDFPLRRFDAFAGKTQHAVAEMLSDWTGAAIEAEAFHPRWREAYDALTAEAVPLRPRIEAALDHLDDLGLPYAIATTTERGHATEKLAKAGIGGRFADIVGFYCVENRKPAPDPYLLAAERLGLPPATCLAFEDSDTGVQAALAAGMTVVQVPDVAPATDRAAHFRADSVWEGLALAGLR